MNELEVEPIHRTRMCRMVSLLCAFAPLRPCVKYLSLASAAARQHADRPLRDHHRLRLAGVGVVGGARRYVQPHNPYPVEHDRSMSFNAKAQRREDTGKLKANTVRRKGPG